MPYFNRPGTGQTNTVIMKQQLLLMAALSVLAAGCGKDDDASNPNARVPDPEGTVPLSMRNANSGGTYLDGIYIDNGDNFAGGWFVSLGAMKGLGNVVSIPSSGWAGKVSAVPGTGYVALSSSGFYRIYVEEYMVSTDGGIIGAEIKYQTPFVVPADIEMAFYEGVYGLEGGETTVPFTGPGLEMYHVASDRDWCGGWVESSVSGGVLQLGLRVYVAYSDEVGERSAALTVSNSAGQRKEFRVTQSGIAPHLDIPFGTDFDVSNEAGTSVSFFVFSNAPWAVTGVPSWLSVSPEDAVGDGEVVVTVSEANATGAPRTASLAVSNGEQSVKVTVTQRAAFTQGKGTLNDPYIVSGPGHLDLIRYCSDAYFRLSGDIDLAPFLSGSEKGWEPIVTAQNISIDGGGYGIRGLWIDRPDEAYAGLFGEANGLSVSDLELTLGHKGINGGEHTGALAARCVRNNVAVDEVHVEGGIRGGTYTGGLFGYVGAPVSLNRVSVKGTVDGTRYAGGFTGYTVSNVSAADSYSAAGVTVTGGAYSCSVGGLLGYQYSGSASFTNCYAAGNLSADYLNGGSAYMGGLTGISSVNCAVASSYFDSDAAGVTTWSGNLNDPTHGRTTAEMKRQSTYEGWNFSTVWRITEGVTYPTLR